MVILLMLLCVSSDKYIGGCYRKRMGCFNELCKRRCRLLYGFDGYCKRIELCLKWWYRCKCIYRIFDYDIDDWKINEYFIFKKWLVGYS